MKILDFIAHKRDGHIHSQEEIQCFVQCILDKKITDYQIAAWLMAAYIHQLTLEETVWLTEAVAKSGKQIDLTSLPKPWVDKHSTGGVGDKTTLVVLPMMAACGLTMVKLSGKGLGITGGTIDKLASIPGFNLDLSSEEMIAIAKQCGIAITGQSQDLAPADKTLYALRDATNTISSIPQIVSSVLGKKIASGAETVLLDVKCGSGAFMKNYESARLLAEALVDVGKKCGISPKVLITDMEQPLGTAIGNALEVIEMIEVLKNKGTDRFQALCIELTAEALATSGKVNSIEEGRLAAIQCLKSGSALYKAREWFTAQGAPKDFFEAYDAYLPKAKFIEKVTHAGNAGWIEHWDAYIVGRTVCELGAGREKKEDSLDYSVGIRSWIEVGQEIKTGDSLFEIHASSKEDLESAKKKLLQGLKLSAHKVEPKPIILASL